MKKMFPAMLIGAALVGFIAGYAAKPSPRAVLGGHFDDLSMIPSAFAQESKHELQPFGFNSPHEPPLAPDAPPIMHWNIDDIRKAHTEMAEKAANSAVVTALAPICADKFRQATDSTLNMVELKKVSSWMQDSYIEKGGWATFAGGASPDGSAGGASEVGGEVVTEEYASGSE